MNKEWFVFKGTHHLGPFSVEEMANLYHKSEINSQSLVWKEGREKWDALSKIEYFQFLFHPEKAIPSVAPLSPPKKVSPEIPKILETEDELPPPIPLDAILDPSGSLKNSKALSEKKLKWSKTFLAVGIFGLVTILFWFSVNERQAMIQLKIKGLMPIYLEKLDTLAAKNSPKFEMDMALSLDSRTLWASTNKAGDIETVVKLTSVPKRVLGTESVVLSVRGDFRKHLAKFNRMILVTGQKFLPGEYQFHAKAHETHFINKHFRALSGISFFKSLNKTYSFEGSALIYPGTPREFEKRLADFHSNVSNELLKPLQDKLERIQTFESILNAISQNYLMTLDKLKLGKGISEFEEKYVLEISPLLQSLVLKAHELSLDPKFNEESLLNPVAPYSAQVLLGKQLGEMASDMITKTQGYKKLNDKDKSVLRSLFDKRARSIKLQIDLNIKRLEDRISELSKGK